MNKGKRDDMTAMYFRVTQRLTGWALLCGLLSGACLAQPMREADQAFLKGDFARAASLWTEQAQRGNLEASFNLALLYRDGKGVSQSMTESLKWSTVAAQGGSPQGQYDMGLALLEGKFLPRDLPAALAWLHQSAHQSYVSSMYALAVTYLDGRLLLADEAKAYYWLLLAAFKGDRSARDYVQRIGERLSETEKASVDRAAYAAIETLRVFKTLPLPHCFIVLGPYPDVRALRGSLSDLRKTGAQPRIWGDVENRTDVYRIKIGPYPSWGQTQQNAEKLESVGVKEFNINCNGTSQSSTETAATGGKPVAVSASIQTQAAVTAPVSVPLSIPLPVTALVRQGGSCPSGYATSGDYCLPGAEARYALARTDGSCPTGYAPSGNFCLASSSSSRYAMPRYGTCPAGFASNGGYCLRMSP
jgi:hypothetical protein